jgi:hypothetical protein
MRISHYVVGRGIIVYSLNIVATTSKMASVKIENLGRSAFDVM